MKNARSVTLGSALAVRAVVALATCASPPRMPALDGAVIEIRRSDDALHEGDVGYAEQLQLYWFGSACHLIQLGGVSLLTDPFVTNDFTFFGLVSDPKRVSATFARIPAPNAVLINHSHHDHLLDAYAAMSLPQWTMRNVPLYGGQSALHLLAGYPQEHLARLRPRNIVFSHFNTFLRDDPDEQLAFGSVDFVKMPEFARDVQDTFVRNAAGYKEFDKLYIPAITTIDSKGFARNVIRIR